MVVKCCYLLFNIFFPLFKPLEPDSESGSKRPLNPDPKHYYSLSQRAKISLQLFEIFVNVVNLSSKQMPGTGTVFGREVYILQCTQCRYRCTLNRQM